MRVLAAADIHGVISVYEWLLGLIPKEQPDVVLLAGDLLLGGWAEDQQKQVQESVLPLLCQAPVPLFYLMGNDDFVGLDYEDKRVRPLHGRRLELGGYGFVGYQYSLPFVGGIFEKSEKEIEADIRGLEPLLDGDTVLVTHSPAYGILDRTYSGEKVGSRSLAELLERRSVLCHVHGHIHESFGREGNRFNVAAAGRRQAVVIELPSLRHNILSAREIG